MKIDSIGEIASRFHISIADVEAALRGEGCEPALVVNGVAYYSEQDQRSIADGLRALKELRERGRVQEDG